MEAKLFWQIHWYHGVNVNLKKNVLEKTFLFDFFINFLRGFAMMLKCAQNISDGVFNQLTRIFHTVRNSNNFTGKGSYCK